MFDLLKITFSDENYSSNEYEVAWKIVDSQTSLLWQKCLISLLNNKEQKIYSRFGGFPDSPRNYLWLQEKINKCIDYLNANTTYKIKEKLVGFDQEIMNKLHHHFEVMIGPIWDISDFYKKLNIEQQDAVCALNYYIHEIEMIQRVMALPEKVRHLGTSSVFVEYIDCKKFFLPEFAFKEFTLKIEFGDILLHYSQTGKTWNEVFLDDDHDVGAKGINPLKSISGEFDIFYGNVSYSEEEAKKLKDFVKKRGGDPEDAKAALGNIIVAKMQTISEKDYASFKSELSQRQFIKSIALVNSQSGQKVQRNYSKSDTYPQDYQIT